VAKRQAIAQGILWQGGVFGLIRQIDLTHKGVGNIRLGGHRALLSCEALTVF